jgi:hypothetical protein
MHRIGIATIAVALGLVLAPRAQAQNSNVSVCQDGTTVSNAGLRTCVGRGGVNAQATARAQQGRYGTNGTTTGRIQCPDGTTSTSGIHGCGTQNGGVYRDPRRTSTNGDVIYGQQRTDRSAAGRDDNDDDKRNGKKWKKGKHKDNGRHLGQLKHADRDRQNDDRN